MRVGDVTVFCGRYPTEEEAAQARDKKVRATLGPAGAYNFPQPGERGVADPQADPTSPTPPPPPPAKPHNRWTGAMRQGVRERPGEFVVGVLVSGSVVYVGTFPTRPQAEAALDAARKVREDRRCDAAPVVTAEELRGLPRGSGPNLFDLPKRGDWRRPKPPSKPPAPEGEQRPRKVIPKGRRWMLRKVRQYRDHLTTAGRTEDYVRTVWSQLRRIVRWGRINGKRHLTADRVMRAVDRLRRQGRSLRSCNSHIVTGKSFARWLYENGHYDRRPLEFLKKFREGDDPRHERRPYTVEEFTRLVEATRSSPFINFGMTPADRVALYVTAASTGMRQGTLRKLQVQQFDLASRPPRVTIHARQVKNRKARVMPLRDDLAALLRGYLANKPPEARALVVPGGTSNTARALRRDLEAAGLSYCRRSETEDGKSLRRESVLDFHSLRHSFISWLVQAGVSPAHVQRLAGHASITTTMRYYVHLNQSDEVAALEHLPSLPPGKVA